MRIHLVANSHIDPVWLWNKYEGIDEVINTFRSACRRLDEYPELKFCASSIQFYKWVLKHDPELFRRIKQKVSQGRWEVTGGWWVEADTNLITEASFRKHADISKVFTQKHFGVVSTVAYLPDTFGHPATLPEILADTGFKYFVFSRPGIHEKTDLPANLFYWEYHGKRVLAYRLKHGYSQYGQMVSAVDSGRLMSLLNDEEYRANPVNCYFFGVGDHGGGPSIAEIKFYDRFIKSRPGGDAGFSTCLDFFKDAERLDNIPVYSGDLHYHAVGCYSVLRDIKETMRRCEHNLQYAERALDINGQSAETLQPLWEKVLFNQFHDILPGTCSPEAAHQALSELGGAGAAAKTAAYEALKSAGKSRPVRPVEGEFRIYNTLPFKVTVPLRIESFVYYKEGAVFRDQNGKEILIQEVPASVCHRSRRWEFVDTLPARGFKSYSFHGVPETDKSVRDEVHFVPGDLLAADLMWVKGKGRVSVLERPVRFLVLEDESDTWGHGIRCFGDVAGHFTCESSAVLEGPVTSKLYRHYDYGRSTVDVIYSLYKGLSRIYFDIKVHWAEEHKILKMELSPESIHRTNLLMQGPGGAILRPADGTELPMHNWVRLKSDASDIALIQEGAFACDCSKGRLRLTLVRSNYYGYHVPAELKAADPKEQTDQGEHRFRFCLLSGRLLKDKPDELLLERLTAAFIEPFPVMRETP